MTETLSSLIAQVKQSKYSQLSSLSEDGLANVWTHVSNFIRKQLCIQKGAGILGLGTFTFSQKFESGGNKASRPIFILSEKFAQLHFLRMSRQFIPGHIPVVPLNFTIISNEMSLKREVAESAVKEVLLALSHSLAANKNVEFELVSIGKLYITDKKVQMKFYKDFINSLDSSGEMGKAFQRCNTASSDTSIISGPCTPRLAASLGPCLLPTIKEHPSSDPQPHAKPLTPLKPQEEIKVGTSEGESGPQGVKEEKQPLQVEGPDPLPKKAPKPEEPGPRPSQMSRQSSRQSLCVPTASGIFYGPAEDLRAPLEGPPKTPPSSCSSRKPLTMPKPTVASQQQTTPTANPHIDLPLLNAPSPGSSRRRTRSLSPSRNRKSTPLESTLSQQKASREAGHTKGSSACQDLCYVCHQRAQRNVFVSFAEEIKERELQESVMWQEYERQQRELMNAREQAARMRNTMHAKDTATFNYQVSAMKQVQRKKRSTEFYPSYVLQHRSVTPPKTTIQQKYCSELDDQVTISRSKEKEKRELETSMDRDFQQQLAKQLALSNEEFQREKAQQRALYQKTLAEQVAIRHEIGSLTSTLQTPLKHAPNTTTAIPSSMAKLFPLPLPKPSVRPFANTAAATSGGTKLIQWKSTTEQEKHTLQPMFGVLELGTDIPRTKEKEDARALFLEQSALAAEKLRAREEKALKAKAIEAETLMNTRKELLQDMEVAQKIKGAVRKKLEKVWSESAKEKQQRLEQERQMDKEPGILILDQCLRNKRCRQCQRRVDYVGNHRVGATV